jgi:hypothetical protein
MDARSKLADFLALARATCVAIDWGAQPSRPIAPASPTGVCAPSIPLEAARLEPPVAAGTSLVTLPPQERTRVRIARSATDNSAKSHVPVSSIAARVVRACANPSEFCSSQRSASSLGLP